MKKPKGSLSVCADINYAMQFRYNNNVKILYIGEAIKPNDLPQGFIPFSILLPPFEALQAEIDNNMQLYERIYTQHLLSKDCVDAFATIVTVIWAGKDVVLLVENGQVLQHMSFLIRFFIINLGLIPATPENRFSFDPAYAPIIALLLYGFNGVITSFDLLKEMQDLPTFIKLASSQMFSYYNIMDRVLYSILGESVYNLDRAGMESVLANAIASSKRNSIQLISFM